MPSGERTAPLELMKREATGASYDPLVRVTADRGVTVRGRGARGIVWCMRPRLFERRLRGLAARARAGRDGMAAAAGATAVADVVVGTAVVAAEPERFGANLDVPGYEPWLANALLLNDWIADGGMEPLVMRYKGTATGGGATAIEHTPDGVDAPAIGEAFFDGAHARVYRTEGGRIRLLRTATVASTRATLARGCHIALAEAGEPVRAGDIFFLALVRDDAPAIDRRHPQLGPLADADTWRVFPAQGDPAVVTARRDPATVAPAHGSRTSLRLRIDAALEGGISQLIAGTPGQRVFNAFEPGRRYRVELWLRQHGLAGGLVTVSLAPYPTRVRRTFAVTGSWARYRLSFTATRRAAGESLARLSIACRGPGTLWVDDVRLFDARWPAHAVRPEVLRALAAYRPGTLRIWSGQTNTTWGTTLDTWLAPEGQGMRAWEPGRGAVAGPRCGLPAALALACACGATPWLIVHPSFDEAEWRGLAEYLAGPPGSPYGARRAAAGQVRPWSEVFARIRIEYGNETWNAQFHPWTFENGEQYGQFAEHFFGVFRASPHYPELAGKVDFVLGGWVLSTGPRGYGASARLASPSASIVGIQPYLAGGRIFRIPAPTADAWFESALLFAPRIIHHLTDQHAATLKLLRKMGYPCTLATTEAGPDYTPPAAKAAPDPEQERRGKSLAVGVSTLDAFLYNSSQGFGPQAYYLLGTGTRWASHTEWREGFRPHAAWLALLLRNRLAEGDMVDTAVTGGPRVDLPEIHSTTPSGFPGQAYRIPARTGMPQIAAYAFRADRRHAVFVLSRHLYQATTIRLHLPTRPTAAALYTLTGDPRASNIDGSRIAIRRRQIRFGQHHTFAMPPGSVYLFVVDSD